MQPPFSLSSLDSFGHVAAEDDPVLSYFLATDSVKRIASGEIMLVSGRKGTGKTAIVRHFTENISGFSRAANLRSYPWNVHQSRLDLGASRIESYVSSWRYIIAVQIASIVISKGYIANDAGESIIKFLTENYGSTNPQLNDIIRPPRLKLGKVSFAPSVMGNSLGGIDLDRANNLNLGRELDALTDAILDAATQTRRPSGRVSLHFDELDQGLMELDETRKAMIVGLILAARSVNQRFSRDKADINVVIYLRNDIWDDLDFSDKNKLNNTHVLSLVWDSKNLSELVGARLRAKIGAQVGWDDIVESGLMRGSQSKWNHILARTFLRPRDIIKFLNSALGEAKKRGAEPLHLTNEDIVSSREEFSLYLKQELDDEIKNHWRYWEDALRACSQISTLTFDKANFSQEYQSFKSKEMIFHQMRLCVRSTTFLSLDMKNEVVTGGPLGPLSMLTSRVDGIIPPRVSRCTWV